MAEIRNWVLLRGLARGTGHWGSFAQKIQERFPQDRFEFIDLPGNGTRVNEKSPLVMKDYVREVRSRCEALRRGEKVHILSISLGGMITVEWMREYPHEVEKSFIICTSAGNFSPTHHRFMLPNVPKAARLTLMQGQAQAWEENILGMVTNSQKRRDAEFLNMVAFTQQYPVQVGNVLRQLLTASRYRFPKQAPGDVKLLGSYGDRLVSPQCTLKIAKRWGLEATMHPWAGHDVPVDDPQWVLEQLL